MSTYSPGGKGHKILCALHGPATFAELSDVLGVTNRHNLRRKTWYLVQKMREDGYLRHEAGAYSATDDGDDALRRLDAGTEVCAHLPIPNIRVFGRRAA